MGRIGLLFIVAVQLFLAQSVRLSERLSCSSDGAAFGLTCRRTIRRLLRSSDETFAIPDGRTIAFQVSGHTTSSHVYMNTSSVVAVDTHGRAVILLSIPDRNMAEGTRVEQRLRDLSLGMPPPLFVFERDDGHTAWLFAMVSGAWWLSYLGLNHFRRVRASGATGRTS
jgi:hypothetical protein